MCARRTGSVVVVLLAALAGCATTGETDEKPARASTAGQVGNIMLVSDASQGGGEKVLVATYLFRAGQVQPGEAIVAFGAAKMPRSEVGDFRIQLIDRQGQVSAEYSIGNPRRAVVEKQGVVEVAESTYSARFPFNAQAREIRVLDAGANIVARTDIGSVIREFCAKVKDDKDCVPSRDGPR